MNMSPLGPFEHETLGNTRQLAALNGDAPAWFGVSVTASPSVQSVELGAADPPQMCCRFSQCPISCVAVLPRSAPANRVPVRPVAAKCNTNPSSAAAPPGNVPKPSVLSV